MAREPCEHARVSSLSKKSSSSSPIHSSTGKEEDHTMLLSPACQLLQVHAHGEVHGDTEEECTSSSFDSSTVSSSTGNHHHLNTRSCIPFRYVICIFSAISGFVFGYDLCVMVSALPNLARHLSLSTPEQELVVSLLMFGAVIGSLAAGILSDVYGRRNAIILTSLLFTLSGFLMASAPSLSVLLLGRFIAGLAIGISGPAVSVYLSEIADAKQRGTLVTAYELMLCTGCLCSIVITGHAFSHLDNGWRYMLGLTSFPAMIQLIGMPFMPQSPTWLEMKMSRRKISSCVKNATEHCHFTDLPTTVTRRHQLLRQKESSSSSKEEEEEEAAAQLWAFPPSRSEPGDRTIPSDYHSAITRLLSWNFSMSSFSRRYCGWCRSVRPMDDDDDHDHDHDNHHPISRSKRRRYMQILLDPYVEMWDQFRSCRGNRKRICISLGIAVAQSFTGASAMLYYSHHILSHVGIESSVNFVETCIALAKLFGVASALVVVDRVGRRRLLLGGAFVMASCYFVCACIMSPLPASNVSSSPEQLIVVSMLILLIFAWNISYAPLMWLVSSEILPQELRSVGMGLTFAAFWLTSALTSQTFLSLVQAVGFPHLMSGYGGLTVLGAAFVYVCVPETCGQSFTDIDQLFQSVPQKPEPDQASPVSSEL